MRFGGSTGCVQYIEVACAGNVHFRLGSGVYELNTMHRLVMAIRGNVTYIPQ